MPPKRRRMRRRPVRAAPTARALHLDAQMFKGPTNPPPVTLTPWYPLTVVIPVPTNVSSQDIVNKVLEQLFLPGGVNIEFRLRAISLWGEAGASSVCTLVPFDLMDESSQNPKGRFSDIGDFVRRAHIGYRWSRAETQQAYKGSTVILFECIGSVAYVYLLWRTVVSATQITNQLRDLCVARIGNVPRGSNLSRASSEAPVFLD